MNKVKFIFYNLLFSFFIFSCSNSENSIIVTQTDNSLRNQMSYLDYNINWTQNLDNILHENESKEENFEDSDEFKRMLPHQQLEYRRQKEEEKKKNKRDFPEGLSEVLFQDRLFYPKNEPPVDILYPELKNFGSLDISLLDTKIKNLIQVFIDGINEKKLKVDCISPETRFLEPIFLEDFSHIGNVSSFLLGKPIIIQNEFLNEYQVPVRMFTENGYYNTLFFLVYLQDSYFIEQVSYSKLVEQK